MNLKDALEKRKFVVTSEVQTPIEDRPESLVDDLKRVRGRIDGIAKFEVEIDGIVGDTIKTCELLQQNRFQAIYQTTTRDKNRIQLQKDLVSAYNAGIENLLVFTEDYRIAGDSLHEMMFFHVDSGKLQSVLEHIRQGRTVDGNALSFRADFMLGSGVESSWSKDVPDRGMKEMEAMAELGTGYFLTTPVFDLEEFEKFMNQVNSFGVPVIAEVMIIRTAGMAKFLNRHIKSGMVPDWAVQKLAQSPDKLQASVEIFADIVEGLKQLCQGVHIVSIGGVDKPRNYMDAAKLR